MRIDQIGRREGGATRLALVAIGALIVAMRTGPCDVAVCEKLLSLRVVVLLRGLLDQLARLVKLGKECARRLLMCLGGGARIDVEVDA